MLSNKVEGLFLVDSVYEDSTNTLTELCYGLSKASGWWDSEDTDYVKQFILQEKYEGSYQTLIPHLESVLSRLEDSTKATKLCLIHSEISEAMEGARKGLQDDHLPHRSMIEVELADALIRIFDLGGALGLDLGGALVEKLNYNQNRADHKLANRAAEGGKKF